MFAFLLETDVTAAVENGAETATAAVAGSPMASLMSMLPLLLLIPVAYFLLIRPQKKKAQETKKMLDSLDVGDIAVTTGGIIGIVTGIKDDSVILETGGDKNKIRIKKWAIQTIETIKEDS